MTSFIVLSHDGTPDEKAGDKTIFVRDAFAVWALAAPIIWLLWYRLWFHASMVVLATALIFLLLQSPNFMFAVLPLNLMLGLLVALEGSAWRVTSLERNDYRQIGIVDAEMLEEAQIIWAMDATEENVSEKTNEPSLRTLNAVRDDDLIFTGTN